jgi:broad specificity phosphatase PhoE
MSTTTVHLLRHGEVFNPDRILYGRLPGFRLSEAGHAMARAAAEHLVSTGQTIAFLVSSPLQRARETAQPLAELSGLTIAVDDRLTEAANVFEGHAVGGENSVLFRPSSWRHYRNPFRPSWGEDYRQVAQRMFAAVLTARDRAQQAAPDGDAVCVSHQLPIVAVRRFVEGQRLWHDPRSRQCSLGSLTSLIFQGDTVVDVRYAEPSGASSNRIGGSHPG